MSADTVTFKGTGMALRGCKITAIQGGQVSYTDSSGQRQRRPLDQIEALGFDGLPELDQAEAALSINDSDAGLWSLLRAAVKASDVLPRIWIHVRLSQVHDLRREYVQAAGHAAEVFALSDDVAWRTLRPVSPVNTPSYAAAFEASERLKSAMRRVKSTELLREMEIMAQLVQNVHDRLAAAHTGPAIETGSTMSGYAIAVVLANSRMPAAGGAEATGVATPPATSATPAASTPGAQPPASGVSAATSPRASNHISDLLAAGRGAEALRLCDEASRQPPAGDVEMALLLYQYGKALALVDRKADAAVMFTRCAILYPDSPEAMPAMIETAVIYRDNYRQPATARRLLQRVIEQATHDQQQAIVLLAQEVLSTLPQSP